ncbi:MAG: phosphoribosylformylglycinamidine synthase subunit PurL [Phycisphaerales bacterium]|nr:phosphoribosylformylglycinamidine synthase subunit PurL [Phycisphaerales bacterium]
MTVHRIEVHPGPDQDDPRGQSVQRDARHALGRDIDRVRTASVYLIEADLDPGQVQTIASAILSDAVAQQPTIGVRPPERGSRLIEVHPLPGVMDPAAQSVELAIRELLGVEASVRTGTRFDLYGVDDAAADEIATRLLANATVQAVYRQPHCPREFPKGHEQPLAVREIAILDLDDDGLLRLSRDGHLFLSLDEMKAIQAEYRRLGREPRDVELETLAQTWSEHCVHKTLKSTIEYRGDLPGGANRPGHMLNADGSITIHNLLKSTVAAATNELIAEGLDWCLSVFVDNAGVIAFDDDTAVCFKVETHNHPSALEPYGGAATGIGGCIRDVIGTGLAAKPIAATDIFCVAYPDSFTAESAGKGASAAKSLPAGCLHPRRILSRVVAGVRDYGNRMGIPTVNGAVYFDDRYVGNPLVYCGCVGVMPRDMVRGAARSGDHIIALGGRTGRDGIHGATFSSAELTDSHADEFSHAVQIGNAVTEKKLLDVILQARDHADGCLFSAITDCGAGGFSSAVGEMGEALGATVHLERAPIKYAGLTYTEIWISEAQERMVLAVPAANLQTLRGLCETEGVEMCDLGTFGTPERELILNYAGVEVGRLSMEFMHEGIPTPTRRAEWSDTEAAASQPRSQLKSRPLAAAEMLLRLLAHPNIASKHWIIRQYDHEVQGQTVVKPLTGVRDDGPSDAAVLTPKLDSTRGLALANGLATGLAADPYFMTLAAIDECVRNLVCVGTDPTRIAILDNFCWPSCGKARNLGSLVRAAEACYDGAKAYRTPFISGKDSLNNQFTTESGETIEIPPTLLISGFGIVHDVRQCVTMDLKRAGNRLVMVGVTGPEMGGSHWAMISDAPAGDASLPRVDLNFGPQFAAIVSELIRAGLVRAAHDCSEGGLLVAAAEMAIAGDFGVDLDIAALPVEGEVGQVVRLFGESPSRYLLEVAEADLSHVERVMGDLPFAVIGEVNDSGRLRVDGAGVDVQIEALRRAWQGTLDW